MKKKHISVWFGMIFSASFFCYINDNQMFAQSQEIVITNETAKKIIADLEIDAQWVNVLSNLQSLNLPIGMKRTIHGREYILAVTKLEFHPEATRMDLILSVDIPYQDKGKNKLYFSAKNVNWSEKGGFAEEVVRLALLADFQIPFGEKMEILLKKSSKKGGTFAEIDCYGLKSINLDASLIFDSTLIIPADCSANSCKKLSVDFSMNVETWSDLIIDLNLPAFQIPILKGWIFQANHAIFDFSENRKSELVKFPGNYLQTYFPNTENFWRGVFIQSMEVTLPEYFESSNKLSFQAQSLIIDDIGVSGKIRAKQIVPKGIAHAGGWGLSIDTLVLDFWANRLKAGYLYGALQIPLLDSSLSYSGKIFENNRFLMQADIKNKVQFECLKTTAVELEKKSLIKMELKENKFLIQAVLHGAMTFDWMAIGADSASLHIPKIGFRNLKLQNHEPYISISEISYDESIRFADFPAQIDGIEMRFGEKKFSIHCDLGIALTSANDGAFKGKTGFSIHARLDENTNHQHHWIFDEMKFEKIKINADNHVLSMKGELDLFQKDPLYGQGFSGSVELKIKQPKITIKSHATFGKTDDFRYWFADGLANFGKIGIPIFPGLSLNGFAGGAYQRMKPLFDEAHKSSVGTSNSGIKYIPDASIKLGVQASVAVCLQSNPSVFNADAGFEIASNSSGGMKFIQFTGIAKAAQEISNNYMEKAKMNIVLLGGNTKSILEKIRKEAEKEAEITASMKLNYDFNNSAFQGLLETKLTAPFLSGNGIAELYFSSDKWYFHIGHPERRCNIRFGVGSIALNAGIYLMTGHDVPQMPHPPKEIKSFVGDEDLALLRQARDISAVKQGKNFIFGSDFAMQTGELDFLIFSAKFQTHLGFDLALKKHENVSCAQWNKPLGINGWYGSGQAYAYLNGKINVDVEIFGKHKEYTILDVQTGMLLQAQLPNPVWFKGNLAAQYNVLNGLVKGHCDFQFELGEKCQKQVVVDTPKVAIITDFKPNDQETDVSVYILPQVAFGMPVQEFQINLSENYKIQLESFELKSQNTKFEGDLEWNKDRTLVFFRPSEAIPPQTEIEASVSICFYEKRNGEWSVLKDENNQIYKETLHQTFRTGDHPKTLPESEILFSYPIIDQQNFYVLESSSGYIQLRRDLKSLFEDKDYDYWVQIESSKGEKLSEKIVYDNIQKQIRWPLPTLKKSTHYTLKILGKQRDKAMKPIEIFSYRFQTSAFSTFEEAAKTIRLSETKFRSMISRESNGRYYSVPDVGYLFATCSYIPDFEQIEVFGNRYTQNRPLIIAHAILDEQNDYFASHIYPLIYAPYDFNGLVQLNRTADQSIIPTWSMFPQSGYRDQQIFPWTYEVPLVYRQDLYDIQVQLADQYVKGKDIAGYKEILTQTIPPFIPGKYRLLLQYQLPCGKLGTSHSLSFDYSK